MGGFSSYDWITWYNRIRNYSFVWDKPSIASINPLLSSDPSGVTVILTVWKRNHLLEQLNSLFNQTEIPYQIWVYQGGSYVDTKKIRKEFPEVEFIDSTINLKYFGRFTLAQFIKSKYTWIFDDDVIPSIDWLEKSRKKCEAENAIIASAGRIIPAGDYLPERMQNMREFFFGDVEPNVPHNSCPDNIVVDFGNNSWFFKSEWIKAFWQIPPYSLETGEDIHLSGSCKIKLGVRTIVLKQSDERTCGNLKKWYGHDAHASWTKPGFLESRASIIQHLVEQHGWQPLLWQEQVNII